MKALCSATHTRGWGGVMHFRVRGRIVQVIRSVYEPSLKRGRTDIVGRLDRHCPTLSESLREACSAEELAEVQRWISQHTQREALVAAYSALTLRNQIEAATRWFETAPVDQVVELGDGIPPLLTKLRQTIRSRLACV